MSEPREVCMHGGLRRKCEICELTEEVRILTLERNGLIVAGAAVENMLQAVQAERDRLRSALQFIAGAPGADCGEGCQRYAKKALAAIAPEGAKEIQNVHRT